MIIHVIFVNINLEFEHLIQISGIVDSGAGGGSGNSPPRMVKHWKGPLF